MRRAIAPARGAATALVAAVVDRAWSSSFDKLRMRTNVQGLAVENLILSLSKDEVSPPGAWMSILL
jgi:hypothetical protein